MSEAVLEAAIWALRCTRQTDLPTAAYNIDLSACTFRSTPIGAVIVAGMQALVGRF